MRRILIIAGYFTVFWILLPALIIGISCHLESLLKTGRSVYLIPGCIILGFSVLLLATSVRQYFKSTGNLPVSAYPPENIIRYGVYNYWRHPIYLFYITTFIGISLLLGILTMLIFVIPALSILTCVYIIIEEKSLKKRFGISYIYYKKQTGLIIPILYQILRYPALILFKALFRYSSKNSDLIPASPPYFIVAEHKNYLDPVFIALSVPHPISYLTTFEIFRTKFMRFIMQSAFSIPKKRYKSDLKSNRQLLETLDKGGVIGIFPEGERSWTGETQSFKPEVLKLLLKKNEIPILPVRIHGNYHVWPRWADRFRRYKIMLEFGNPFIPESGTSPEDLENRIRNQTKSISVPDKINKKDTNIGEGLEKLIYRCSECREFNTFSSDENGLTCRNCSFQLKVSADLKISFIRNGSLMDMSVGDYYRSIKVTANDSLFKTKVSESESGQNGEVPAIGLKESAICRLYTEKDNIFLPVLDGRLILDESSLIFKNDDNEILINYRDISSITTESNCKLQLYDNMAGQLYQVKYTGTSVLQWQDILISVVFLKTGRAVNTR